MNFDITGRELETWGADITYKSVIIISEIRHCVIRAPSSSSIGKNIIGYPTQNSATY